MPPAFVALGVAEVTQDQVNVALPLAVGFWLIGLLFALWAAFPTLRYWEALPQTTRWLGALPMLSVSLFFSAALIARAVRLKEGGRRRTEQGDAVGTPPPYPAACGAGMSSSLARLLAQVGDDVGAVLGQGDAEVHALAGDQRPAGW